MPAAHPTGAQHEVAIDEIFFSTTDDKGVIQQSNEVFVRLSRYPHQELVGAPHNLIRHPEMPGGAFYAMWQTLEAGSPFVAYVHNLAKDGSRYDVLATVSPLPDGGYLSVRTRPMLTDIAETASRIYADTHAEEQRLRSNGANRRAAAQAGADQILERLSRLGFDGYSAFQRTVLPAEVVKREAVAAGFPERANATGVLKGALEGARHLQQGLDAWMGEQDALASTSTALTQAAGRIEKQLEAVSTTSNAIAASSAAHQNPNALVPLQLWSQMQGLVGNQLSRLLGDISRLAESVAETRFRIALARLQSSMLANFIAEIVDAGPDAQRARSACAVLIDAVRAGIEVMGESSAQHRRLSAQVADLIDRTLSLASLPIQLLLQWRSSSVATSSDSGLADLVPTISSAITETYESLAALETLGHQCRDQGQDQDRAPLLAALTAIEPAGR